MRLTAPSIILLVLVATTGSAQLPAKKTDDRYPYRTDFANAHLPWFQLKAGEFPPEHAAHAIGGELVGIDRINRTGTLRLDRTDAQPRGQWDLPLPFAMLPYGSVWYRGAPAELRDIPLGTHLTGQFYWDDARAKDAKTKQLVAERKLSPDDRGFHDCVRIEDDFSLFVREGKQWRIDAVDFEKKTISAVAVGAKGETLDTKPGTYQINDATRIWKGRGFGNLADLKAGDHVLINFTFKTMRLDGRCADIWLDAESRKFATAQHLEVHRLYQRERGLAGWVGEVDDKKRTMTVTLFEGFDPTLLEDFAKKPIVKEKIVDPFVAVAVAEDSLRAYDPINDVKRGPILGMKSIPAVPGSSGRQIIVQPDLMLEGFRTGRVVRIFAGVWGVTDLPREEKLFQ